MKFDIIIGNPPYQAPDRRFPVLYSVPEPTYNTLTDTSLHCMADHGLRTTGTHTGNYGRAKVKGKPGELDLTPEILNRSTLRIPSREEAYARLAEAYNTTTDPKLKADLWEMLRVRIATVTPRKSVSVPQQETFWDEVRRTR
jgi:hypothetical protein